VSKPLAIAYVGLPGIAMSIAGIGLIGTGLGLLLVGGHRVLIACLMVRR